MRGSWGAFGYFSERARDGVTPLPMHGWTGVLAGTFGRLLQRCSFWQLEGLERRALRGASFMPSPRPGW